MKKIVKSFVALFLALNILILSSFVCFATSFEDDDLAVDNTVTYTSSNNVLKNYNEYINKCGTLDDATETLPVEINNFNSENADTEYNEQEKVLYWKDGNGSITWNFDIDKTAFYNIEIVWKPLASGVDVSFGLQIDGEYCFDNMNNIVFKRLWQNASDKPRTDDKGNEYAQEQKEFEGFRTSIVRDNSGVVDNYSFALSQGTHSITLVDLGQGIAIEKIIFTPPESIFSYSDLLKDYKLQDCDAEIITIQGENADLKSSKSLIPKSNNSEPSMTPNSSVVSKINYIGGTAWQSPCSSLTWNFKVDKSGYYYINIRYKQADLVNGNSLRWLKIDGKTPFNEAKNLSFPYDAQWKYYTFSDAEKTPYYIWLEKGEHTITLEATMNEQSEFFSRLSEIVDILGNEYIKIVMITGETPDVNRDYELFNQIPNFTDTLTNCYNDLTDLANDMKSKSGKNSTQAIAAMENMARVLNNMLKNPFIAQQYVNEYYTNYTSVSSWLYDMTNMPLSLDEIQIVPYGKEYENKNANFIKKLFFGITRLVVSFTEDYVITDDEKVNYDNEIRLWVNWGQDQAAVLDSLIEDSFTSKTGIPVKLEIVNASLVNGILAGNFPDIALHMSRTEPVNLGIRGALADLTQFEDYSEVLERFQDGAEIPYMYKDALYALPDTQSYFLMFYRKDIFDKLELEVPETWEEFLYVSTIIQRNNMSVYVPYTRITSSTTVNAGIGNLNMYPTLLSQNNLSIYNKELNATDLLSIEAIDTFNFWTDFYTKYDFYKEADFYNRFRVGVMPLGIATYNTYMTLYSAAPEIQDRWSIALVPGTKNEDGIINRSVAGGGTGCAIIEKSSNKDEAWEFLKWWTSAETQSRYNNNVESLVGMIGRTATSTVDAFSAYAWEQEDLDVLLSQWENVKELPEVPGSYYLSRAIDQAYWSVINGKSISSDALTKWSMVADEEIARKIKEYS